jgi:serine/threonine protein kinase
MGAACSSIGGGAKPQWSSATPLAFGSDKEVFMGAYKGKPVAICVAKKQGRSRLQREIQVLNQLGSHPNIVQMLYSNTSGGGAYLALECVEPIGFDHDRLVKQYLFAKQSVPSLLTRTLIKQLCSALDQMHSRQIIHRDIKSENVLITRTYDAKLIDMGIACKLGTQEERWVWNSKSYFAPELCQGSRPQGTEVDTWGLGLILHQTYQHRWDLVDASKDIVVARADRPSKVEPMENDLMEAMIGLLAFDPAKRWSTKKTQEKIPPEAVGEGRDGWMAAVGAKAETRSLLHKYRDSQSPLTAYAAIVDGKNKNLIGKKVGELRFRQDHNAILLLVDIPGDAALKRKRSLEKSPGKDTVIEEGAWLYFGMPPNETNEDAVVGLKRALFPSMSSQTVGRSVNAKAGLMAFTLEFDCFTFPEHIGKKACIGSSTDASVMSLNLRGNFGLNLAGIVKKNKEVDWFPGPLATVDPGDLGLVVRCPCQDGTTEPTVLDEQLQPMMDKATFDKLIKRGASAANAT